jgi:hypothetical protein
MHRPWLRLAQAFPLVCQKEASLKAGKTGLWTYVLVICYTLHRYRKGVLSVPYPMPMREGR